MYLISCSRGRAQGGAWEVLEPGTGQPWGCQGALCAGQGDRVCWAETGRKTGPCMDLHAHSVKHPAQKHTKITPAARANISHPCSHHAPYSGRLSSSPSALRQCLTPPPQMLMSKKPQSTGFTSSHLPPKPSSAPLLLLSSPSPRANHPSCPQSSFPPQQDPHSTQHRHLDSRSRQHHPASGGGK